MSGSPPRVSVIIPTYNQAALLDKALQSVICQTFSDWEAIVIDNHSDDGTRDVVEAFRDDRIRYVAFSNKGIIAASRNLGIRMAAGSVIAFLDSDDLWYPSKLSVCMGSLECGAEAVSHGLRVRRNGILEETLGPKSAMENVFEVLLYQGNSAIATSAVMIKKEVLDRLGVFSEDPSFVTAEDYELWLRLAASHTRWEFLPNTLGEYTVHGKNASSSVRKQMLAEEQIVILYFRKKANPHLWERVAYRRRRMMVIFRAGARIWQSGNHCTAISYFMEGFYRAFG